MCKTLEKQNGTHTKTKTSHNGKRVQRFCQNGKLCEHFLPRPTRILKPIYDFTRKGRPFIWGDKQQKAFQDIKDRLQNPPVLHLPDNQG